MSRRMLLVASLNAVSILLLGASVPGDGVPGIKPGDTVVVAKQGTTLQLGKESLAKLRKGTEMVVSSVKGDWVGGAVVIDGKRMLGWVMRSDVDCRFVESQPTGDVPVASEPSTEHHRNAGPPADADKGRKLRLDIGRPAIVTTGILALPPSDVEKLARRVDKVDYSKASQLYRERWVVAMQGATKEECTASACSAALLLFLPLVDGLWDKEHFQLSRLDRYVARLRQLRPETTEAWKEELKKVVVPLGGGVNDLEMAALLIQMDRLFTDDGFNERESAAFLARMRSLDPKAIDGWKNANRGCYSSQAVIELIQNNGLFQDNLFQAQRFQEALAAFQAHQQ